MAAQQRGNALGGTAGIYHVKVAAQLCQLNSHIVGGCAGIGSQLHRARIFLGILNEFSNGITGEIAASNQILAGVLGHQTNGIKCFIAKVGDSAGMIQRQRSIKAEECVTVRISVLYFVGGHRTAAARCVGYINRHTKLLRQILA